MNPWFDPRRWDLASLRLAWRAAQPFPHVLVEGLVAPARLDELRHAVAEEPHRTNRSDIFEMMSSEEVTHPALVSFREALGSVETLAALAELSGKLVTRAELRSFVYLPGSFLLPHSDGRIDAQRAISWVFYLSEDADVVGGELELFSSKLDGAGEVIETAPAKLIRPVANRLLLFDVSTVSLHQVREVLSGGRVSLSGWYYP